MRVSARINVTATRINPVVYASERASEACVGARENIPPRDAAVAAEVRFPLCDTRQLESIVGRDECALAEARCNATVLQPRERKLPPPSERLADALNASRCALGGMMIGRSASPRLANFRGEQASYTSPPSSPNPRLPPPLRSRVLLTRVRVMPSKLTADSPAAELVA